MLIDFFIQMLDRTCSGNTHGHHFLVLIAHHSVGENTQALVMPEAVHMYRLIVSFHHRHAHALEDA